MKANIHLFGNRWKWNVEVEEVKKIKEMNRLVENILVRSKDIYSIHKESWIFELMYLRDVFEEGYIVSPCKYGSDHKHFVKHIYWYKENK